ncbi:MAG: serine hydrolase [Micropepsaceae bacterium]
MLRSSVRAFVVTAAMFVLPGTSLSQELVSFPVQPEDVPYPTQQWPEIGNSDPLRIAVTSSIAPAFEGVRPKALARTKALVVVWSGRIVTERYASGVQSGTRLQSWSMAKSLLHAALGVAIADGKIRSQGLVDPPEWRRPNDPRHPITVRQMAQMTDGLDFDENYGDPKSPVMQMLFGSGRGDVAGYAAKSLFAREPGTFWSYSSGSANILSRKLRDTLGGKHAYLEFLRRRIFLPIGMTSAVAEFDASGTWIGSSFIHATARDYARFGLLYLRGGAWNDKQIVPREWVNVGRTPTLASRGAYGALFWLNAVNPNTGRNAISSRLPEDMFMARGFGGQFIAIIPSRDAVIVMLNAAYGDDVQPIIDLIADTVDSLPTLDGR